MIEEVGHVQHVVLYRSNSLRNYNLYEKSHLLPTPKYEIPHGA